MQNSLRSRKKLNAEIMYDMRRQGMSNKQIAENMGIAVSTVYDHIGKKSMAVRHAEEQNKPPVVDVPVANTAVISAESGFKPFAPEAVTFVHPPANKPLLAVVSAKYTMHGELCQYTIDTSAGTVELVEGASMVTGMLDRDTIRRFIEELEQVSDMLGGKRGIV